MNYNYDGQLAAYFLLAFLVLLLVPLSLSFTSQLRSKPVETACECSECSAHREQLRKSGNSLFAGLSTKAIITISGWVLFTAVLYVVITSPSPTSTVYDPFAILGISESANEKEIKKHYKKLSLKYHPDTVKLAENQTVDDANEYFIKLTKAYKALTDEEIRRNYLEYGDPDGKQSMTVGLALPPWLIDAHNNIWVLAAYGVLFGGLLPYLVGQWWFGSRSKTKDGVHVKTASILFKDMVEDVTNQKILVALSKAAENDNKATSKVANNETFSSLETSVLDTWRKLGETYVNNIKSEADSSKLSRGSYVAYILFSAHLLRIAVPASLKKLQTQLLIHVPTLLNSQVSMALGHNWYSSARSVMQMSACFVQALHPSASPLLQFPSVTQADLQGIKDNDLPALLSKLNQSEAPRAKSIRTASKCWGKVDIVDARFKVIGERIITPGAFVNIVMKLRLVDPAKPALVTTLSKNKEEADVKDDDVKDEEELLLGKKEMADLKPGQKVTQNAHAPRWPMVRKPRWWCFLADVKNNKVFIYPVRIGDIPHATGSPEHDYRTFKVQFQAPQQVGTYTLRLVLVSDTFVGEEQGVYLQLQVDDLSALSADEQLQEDEISDPEEDSLAGQMAVMRGGKVKPSKYHQGSDDEDEESETDEDESDSESSDDD